VDISIKACTDEGERVVPANVEAMKPSSRTRRREARRIAGIRECVCECFRCVWIRVLMNVREREVQCDVDCERAPYRSKSLKSSVDTCHSKGFV
jgi:hypothetical protein